MSFQNFTLVPALSVFENVALFQPNLPAWCRSPSYVSACAAMPDRFRLAVDPWAPVRQLAVGDQQKVEILKQLLGGARVLILDEPTRVLAPQESEGLFRTIAELRGEGLGVVLITHKLHEVLACADRIVVMRQGRIAGVLDPERGVRGGPACADVRRGGGAPGAAAARRAQQGRGLRA